PISHRANVILICHFQYLGCIVKSCWNYDDLIGLLRVRHLIKKRDTAIRREDDALRSLDHYSKRHTYTPPAFVLTKMLKLGEAISVWGGCSNHVPPCPLV